MTYVNWKKLKERVSIGDILTHYNLVETLRETRNGYEGPCPFCGSSAFKVNTEKNAWYCFGECKTGKAKSGGNILDLVARMESLDVKHAAIRIDGWFPEDGARAAVKPPAEQAKPEQGSTETAPEPKEDGAARPRFCKENVPLPFMLQGIDPEHEAVVATGIDRATAREYGVGYFSGKGTMHNRLVFPYHDVEGKVLAYAGFAPEDGSWKYPSPDKFNPSLELYGYYHALPHTAKTDFIAVCRDPRDALRYRTKTNGMVPVIAIPTPECSAEQLALLEVLVAPGGRLIVVIRQGDLDGEALIELLASSYFVMVARY